LLYKHEVKGTIREIAGKISDKSDLAAAGSAEKMTDHLFFIEKSVIS
jgi:uncharacterized protein YjbJ (UPF0337 family)